MPDYSSRAEATAGLRQRLYETGLFGGPQIRLSIFVTGLATDCFNNEFVAAQLNRRPQYITNQKNLLYKTIRERGSDIASSIAAVRFCLDHVVACDPDYSHHDVNGALRDISTREHTPLTYTDEDILLLNSIAAHDNRGLAGAERGMTKRQIRRQLQGLFQQPGVWEGIPCSDVGAYLMMRRDGVLPLEPASADKLAGDVLDTALDVVD
jgi:hypothetical protein